MKWITALVSFAVSVAAMGCTITVKPIEQKTSRTYSRSTHRHYPSSRTVKRTTPKPSDESHQIKETWWIENYKKLEAAHGDYTISDDARIEPLPDGRFKVPDTVLSHYQDMLLAKPTPKP